MAEPLKNFYGPGIPQRIGTMIGKVHPTFRAKDFVAHALDGYEELELLPRGRKIALSLKEFLPADYEEAVDILLASLGPRPSRRSGDGGIAPFIYLPHTHFVASYGLEHFELSMRAQHRLTQVFTCEFSIRPFLEQHTEATLERLHEWTKDPDEHVRRLVSEGTRSRLPWASRLRDFQQDPTPVLALLEKLKDDPALYVRRSVANNLNDIGKDHPGVLVKTAGRWMKSASEQRQWVVRHALRSAIKRSDPDALAVMGFGKAAQVDIMKSSITPGTVREGDKVRVSVDLHNPTKTGQNLLADLCVHYVKANGSTAPKVFKMTTLSLAPGETQTISKLISLLRMTTRRHYPGKHSVQLLINGKPHTLGHFVLKI